MSDPKVILQEAPEEDLGPFIPQGWDEESINEALGISPGAMDLAALKAQQDKAEALLEGTNVTGVDPDDVCDASISLYEAYMLEAKRRAIVQYESHVPFYICSLGAHIANALTLTSCGRSEHRDRDSDKNVVELSPYCTTRQLKKTLVHVDGGTLPDLRAHVMTVGAAGAGKMVFPGVLLDRTVGLIPQDVFPNTFVGYVNRPSLFGSVYPADDKGNIVYDYGMLYQYCSGIVMSEEFNAVKSAAQASYNSTLEDQLLQFFEKGVVEVSMKYGAYSYMTGTTWWMGNQTDRMWLGSGESGLTRRLVLDYIFVTEEVERAMALSQRVRRRIPPSGKVREVLGHRLKELVGSLAYEKIEWTEDFVDLLDSFGLGHVNAGSDYFGASHTDVASMEKLAIGYNVMRYGNAGDKTLWLKVDDDLKGILTRENNVRQFLLAHRNSVEAEIILRIGLHGTAFRREALVREMKRLGGHSPDKVDRIIDAMVKRGRLLSSGENTWDPILRFANPDCP